MNRQQIRPGARLGRYTLCDPVGAGSFAQVWTACTPGDPHPRLAIKIAGNDEAAQLLLHERAVPRPSHPNIVPVLDGSRRFARPAFVVMPYLSGGSLADLVAQHPHGLPEMRCEALLKDILRGLEAAHRCGIVHRDLKPSNVLINARGHANLTDFGLSVGGQLPETIRSLQQSASLGEPETRRLAGTLAYMAPEVRDAAPATPASDVYAVGVILFEMLTGRRPQGIEAPARVRMLRHGPYWNGLYRGACAGPDERFDNAGMMLRAVRSYGLIAARRQAEHEYISQPTRRRPDPLRPWVG